MIARAAAELGPFLWLVAGFVLLAVELAWPAGRAFAAGLAAIATGAAVITLQFTPYALTPLIAALLFAALLPVAHEAARKLKRDFGA